MNDMEECMLGSYNLFDIIKYALMGLTRHLPQIALVPYGVVTTQKRGNVSVM